MTKPKEDCSDPFCRCHDHSSNCCGNCRNLPIVQVTLGLALPDHTWSEVEVEFECDPEFDDDDSFDLQETAFNHWLKIASDDANKLAPSGWFLISWQWKE